MSSEGVLDELRRASRFQQAPSQIRESEACQLAFRRPTCPAHLHVISRVNQNVGRAHQVAVSSRNAR
jgi:hypothetical protein